MNTPQVGMTILGETGSSKTYTYQACAFMHDLPRNLEFDPVTKRELREKIVPTINDDVYYSAVFRDHRRGTVLLKAYDPIGGELTEPNREVLAKIRGHGGVHLLILLLDPATLQRGPERVAVLSGWIHELARDPGKTFVAIVYGKADELGIPYGSMGRVLGPADWAGVNHAGDIAVGAASGPLAARKQMMQAARGATQKKFTDELARQAADWAIERSIDSWVTVFGTQQCRAGLTGNAYFCAAVPHVPGAAQLAGGATGRAAPPGYSAGLVEVMGDFIRWVCEDPNFTF